MDFLITRFIILLIMATIENKPAPTLEEIQGKYRQALPIERNTEKRPEFYNGVRVRMPEDYDFSNKSSPTNMQTSIGTATRKTTA